MALVAHKPQIPTGTGRDRLMQLAQPKEHKMVWITSCGPRVTWGTQETLWPVPKGALNARTTDRLVSLSQPKRNFQTGDYSNRPEFMYSAGRSSVIWKVSPGAQQAEPSGRIQQLAEHKLPPGAFQADRGHFVFSCGRASPIWKVSQMAQSCSNRGRTESLAQHKQVHADHLDNRGVQTQIPPSALLASCTGRLESLAAPKSRPEGPFREPQWPVTQEAKKASPAGRTIELSKPKSVPDSYLSARDVQWQVGRAARKAQATTRLEELSAPIVRASMDHVQFDPNAFIVKESALKGRASRRVEELAQPLQR